MKGNKAMKKVFTSATTARPCGAIWSIVLLAVILLVPVGSVMAGTFSSPVHRAPATGDCMPFYFNGTYHLCMIYNGGWSHHTSTDLLNWTELPMIIEHGGPTDPDSEHCFTGDIIEHNGVYHMYYSGVSQTHPDGNMQCIHATSTDMINFTKHYNETWGPDGINYKTKAQSDHTSIEDPTFKDQRVVWNENTQEWWMFFSAEFVTAQHPALALATSTDLVNWTQVPPIQGLPAGDCTDVFKIGNWWYRISDTSYWRAPDLAGPWSANPIGAGRFDTWQLVVPKRMFDGTRHVLMGGMRNLFNEPDWADGTHVYAVAIPREVYADADGWLCTRPVPEVTAVFDKPFLDLSTTPAPYMEPLLRDWDPAGSTNPWRYQGSTLVNYDALWPERPHFSFDVPLDYMMEATVILGAETTLTVGFREQPDDPISGYKLTINRRTSEVSISSPSTAYPRTVNLGTSGTITIQAFVIGSIIECWINDAYAFSLRAYDFPQGRLSFETNYGVATITSLTVSSDVDDPHMGGDPGPDLGSGIDFADDFDQAVFDSEWFAYGGTALNGSGQAEFDGADQRIIRSNIDAGSFTMELDYDNLWFGSSTDSADLWERMEYLIIDSGTDPDQFFGIWLRESPDSSNINFRCWTQFLGEGQVWDPAYDHSVSLGTPLTDGNPYAIKIVYDDDALTYTVSQSINGGPWQQIIVREVPAGWTASTNVREEQICFFGGKDASALLDYYSMSSFNTTCSQDPDSPDYVKGDLSGDCDVDLEDFSMFADQWLSGL